MRIVVVIFICVSSFARSDHFSGSSITYECLGGNQYKIFLNLYLDCNGAGIVDQDLNFSSSCGTSFTLTDLSPVHTMEVSPVCPEELDNTSCNGGYLPGFRFHRFEVVTYLSPCDHWNIHWSVCCRNTMVNIMGVPGLYVNATLNNTGGLCDNSPLPANTGIPYVCVNTPIHYNPAYSDPDGHSLSYALISARYASPTPTPVTYNNGYSGTEPVAGITLDQDNGQIQFTPTTPGNYTVVLEITSYKNDGTLIGRIMNDMMFVVPACENAAPVLEGLENVQNTFIMAIDTFVICGNSFCVEMEFSDDDPDPQLSILTNADQFFTGTDVTFSSTGPSSAILCGTIDQQALPVDIFVQVTDGTCPLANWSSMYITALECVVLPVELISFDVTVVNDGNLLRWSTGSGSGTEYHIAERAGADHAFIPLATVPVTGLPGTPSDYEYLDQGAPQGTNFYRLTMVDHDGSFDHGPVVAVENVRSSTIALHSDGDGGWWIQGVEGPGRWRLADALGRWIAEGKVDPHERPHIARHDLPPGVDLIIINTTNGDHVLKLPMPPRSDRY